MSAVWASNRYASGSLLILLAMADYANDDDNTCRPAIPSLTAKAPSASARCIASCGSSRPTA